VFSTRQDALRAREALLYDGFAPDDLTVSIDLLTDDVAAEAPGQAYVDPPDAAHTGLMARLKSGFASGSDPDAERLAAIQRGSTVLTVSGPAARHSRAVELLELFRPVAIRRA
jgi:hypothetical protein